MTLNRDLVRSRRRQLQLSQRQLAKTLGVTSGVIAGIEAGTNHNTLSVGFLARLAEALATHLTELFAEPEPSPPSEPDRLVAEIGALLYQSGTLTPVEALADSLDIEQGAVDDALDQLAAILGPVGLTLHRRTGQVAIRPAARTGTPALKPLLRHHLARRGLKLAEARLLRRILDGEVDEARLGNVDTVALNRLRQAGLITDDPQPSPTADVVHSLLLADQPPTKGDS